MQYFREYLQKINIKNIAETMEKFVIYQDFLAEKNTVMNLTAIDKDEYFEKHFYDSLLLSELHNFTSESLLDIGSGAGFPGLVLALVYPKLKVTLLEPTRKRANFLNETVKLLKLNNVTVVSERAEDYINEHREAFDLVTARAVAHMSVLLELAAPFVKVNGYLLAMKGQSAQEELEAAKHALNVLNLTVVEQKKHQLITDKATRINFKIIKTKRSNSKYPRNYGQIKKNPL
ncbi:MAG TPA: 16S rRNA (guanine(527)-N(7))-methyltransferase RsmG [Bacilli bacterium]|nr:16S rRNA (guanine(527)-N(7))-methyltransferase RsmG [Bacilli bacterium]